MRKVVSIFFFSLIIHFSNAQTSVINMLTEHQKDPLCIDANIPRLSWQINNDKVKSLCQIAYEIVVDTTDINGNKKLVWSSNKIKSAQSVDVYYGGRPLKSATRYYWKVRIWDNHNQVTEWSNWATWKMGLTVHDWKARWIGPAKNNKINQPAPKLRTVFVSNEHKEIQEATAYITAHGFYEASINGRKVGDAYLTPGWTSYNKRLQYQAYDVKELLQKGKNVIGVNLGSGWYRSPLGPYTPRANNYGDELALLLQIKVVYTDGSTELIQSDKNWKSDTGEIQLAEIYDGCVIDLRNQQPGWQSVGFNDNHWASVKVLDLNKSNLIATQNEPVRVKEVISPVKLQVTPKGENVIDFGQNLVGWVKLKVKGLAGDSIKVSYAEVLDKAGNFYTENLRSAKSQDIYILNNEGVLELSPQFTWHGFRYARIEGLRAKLSPENFIAEVIYSDMEVAGSFSCSNPLLNQLQHNIQWGQKGNFLDVPTDCPQRDERLGWTGDAQVFSRTATFNMNVQQFFYKWMQDVKADQFPSGSIPFIIPDVFSDNKHQVGGSTGWGDVATIIPWNMYMAYGDQRILANQYLSMKAWVTYIQKQTKNDLWSTGEHFGDWLFYSVNNDRDGTSAITSKYLIAQCFYAHSVEILANTAAVLNNQADEKYYRNLLSRVKKAFVNEYVTTNGLISSDTQTAYALALIFDMLPQNLRMQAAARLAKNIARYDNHLTTGFLGTPYLCEALSKFGYDDVAYKLLLQKTYPSWLYPITMGATTIWERWDGIRTDGSFEESSMNSYNHYSYGAIGDWMYRHIAGIQPSSAGYKKIVIKPVPGGGLSWAKAFYNCPYGRIESEWKLTGGTIELAVTIPPNTTADVFVPDAKGINYKHYMVGSGTYVYKR